MSIKSTAERGIDAAFKALGPLVRDAVYKEVSGQTRIGPDLNLIFTETAIKCVVTYAGGKEEREPYGMTFHNHRKILVPRKGLSVEIRPLHSIVVDGTEYRITDVRTDPTESMFIVYAEL